MAEDEGKKIEEEHLPPVRVGDKYICPRCKAEVPVRHECPVCRLEIDWTKI